MTQLSNLPSEIVEPAVAGRVLLVDDDRWGIAILEAMLEGFGYSVETAANGAEAWALMREEPEKFDLVLTDRMMPVMDGLALTRRLKRNPETEDIPIVLLTGARTEVDITAGIEAGAFYYLVKPAQPNLVETVLESAMKEVRRKQGLSNKLGIHQAAFQNIQVLRMTLKTPQEVEPVCSLLASLHDTPETIIQGIYELVQNGVEHGLLQFGFEAKARLLASGEWHNELESKSRSLPPTKGEVEATMLRRPDALILKVKDPGPGFKWRPYLAADPSRSSALCGRGIARANTFIFNKLVYNEAGNEATALMQIEKKVRW